MSSVRYIPNSRVGVAQAIAMEEQVRAYGGPQYQVAQHVMNRLAEAVERSGVDVVPKVVVAGSGQSGGGGLLETLMTLILSEKMGVDVGAGPRAATNPQAEAYRDRIRKELLDDRSSKGPLDS